MSNEKEIKIKEVFKFFDMNDDGILNQKEFDDAVKTLGILVPNKELEDYLNKVPIINYENFFEFCNAKLSMAVNKNELIKGFQFLDPDNKLGYVKKCDIEKAFKTIGECLKQEDVDKIFKNCSESQGKINYKTLINSLCGK